MNKNFLTLSLLILGVVALGFGSVYAYQGDLNTKGPNYTPERHEAMIEAFENKDYNAWKEARGDMGNGRMMETINNEENFAKFVKMRELRLAGDEEGASALRAELGLGLGQGKDGSIRKGMKENHKGQNTGGKFIDANGDGRCDHFDQ